MPSSGERSLSSVQASLAGVIGGLVTIAGVLGVGGILGLVHLLPTGIAFGPVKGGGGSTNSPIVVRGGSMTVRTPDPQGWQKKSSSSYCSDSNSGTIDTSHIEFVDVIPSSNDAPLSLSNIQENWEIDVFGRTPADATQPSNNGIKLVLQPKDCNSVTSKNSVMLSLLDNGASTAFYSPLQEGNTHAEGFQDNTGNCPQPTAENLCNRISQIKLIVGAATYNYTCPNGECIIGVGK